MKTADYYLPHAREKARLEKRVAALRAKLAVDRACARSFTLAVWRSMIERVGRPEIQEPTR